MGIPHFLRPIAGLIGEPGVKLGSFALLGGLAAYNVRREVREGHNPVAAAARESLSFAQMTFLGWQAQIALMGTGLAYAAGKRFVRGIHDYNQFSRQARTPFSHRFEHSQASARAQMLGLQQIGQAFGFAQMGSEAASMAARYGRRSSFG